MSDETLMYANDQRLHTLLYESMNTVEQRIFIDSFKLYLDYGTDDKAFVINLDSIWEWIGFTSKYNAKRLLIKSFINNTDYIVINKIDKISNIQIDINDNTHFNDKILSLSKEDINKQRGGGLNKEIIYINVKTFKKFCLRANTDKAEQVQDYYLKMESILQIYLKQCIKDNAINNANTNRLMNEIQDSATNERHKALLAGFDKRRLVYILFIKNLEDGQMVIKIGSTEKLGDRVNHIASFMKVTPKILDVFPCENHKNLENFVHNNGPLLGQKYTEVINNAVSRETYVIKDMKTVQKIKYFINKNIYQFYARSIEELRLQVRDKEIEKEIKVVEYLSKLADRITDTDTLLKILTYPIMVNITNLVETCINNKDQDSVPKSDFSVSTISTHTDINNTNISDTSPNHTHLTSQSTLVTTAPLTTVETNTISTPIALGHKGHNQGPIVQLYDPADLTSTPRVINGLMQAIIDIKGANLKLIKDAAAHRTVYKGYRWFLLPRTDLNPAIVRDIGETISTRARITGYIAQLNLDKSNVIKVYPLQISAAEAMQEHPSVMSNAVKYCTIARGFYWMPWEHVSSPLQTTYLSSNTLPTPHKNIRGVKVHRLNAITGAILEEYPSIQSVYVKERITSKTIKRAVIENITYNGYKWKII
jgi:hypothetical protein